VTFLLTLNDDSLNINSQGTLNNDLAMNSEPTNSSRSTWYTYPSDTSAYWNFFDSSTSIAQSSYPFDIVKVHIVSGYNFDDIPGFFVTSSGFRYIR